MNSLSIIEKMHNTLSHTGIITDWFETRPLAINNYPDDLLVFFHSSNLYKLNQYHEIHNRFCLITTLKGRFGVIVSGIPHIIEEGNAILIFPFQNHFFTFEDKNSELFFIMFNQKKYSNLSRLLNNTFSLNSESYNTITSIINQWQMPQDNAIWNVSLLTKSLLKNASNHINNPINVPSILTEVITFLKQPQNLLFSAKEISEIFNFNQSTLSQMFRSHLGTTLGDLLLRSRLEHTIQL
ncbi:MAG: hypothetical protein ACRC37_04940, partial [Lentisphaeria bacterium]